MYLQGTSGYYWSSTAYSSATRAYFLRLASSGGVDPADHYYKYYGVSLRCLARDKKEAAVSYTHYPNYTSMTNSAGPEFVLGGRRVDISVGYQITNGGYWSDFAYSVADYAYTLRLDNTDEVRPAYDYNKYPGRSLRCLALLHPHHLPTTH